MDEQVLLTQLLQAGDKERSNVVKKQTTELRKAERLFAKMYEDWSAERITEYNFNILSQKYQGDRQNQLILIRMGVFLGTFQPVARATGFCDSWHQGAYHAPLPSQFTV